MFYLELELGNLGNKLPRAEDGSKPLNDVFISDLEILRHIDEKSVSHIYFTDETSFTYNTRHICLDVRFRTLNN